jgi:YidC/Oxa1 family membrane protein insertase
VHVFLTEVPIFSPAIRIVARFIVFLGNATGGNLGVTIILFTVLIKLLLAPLTFKSIRSSKAMQDVAPIIKDLQKKYKDDKQAFAQEQMKVYQQYGINPLAGCLPVLIQLPVFLVVYRSMLHVANSWTGHKGFLWVHDLTQREGLADPLRILVFLAFIFQVIQTRMSLPDRAKRASQDKQTQMQSNLITFSAALVLLFGWNFLSAMVLYWAVQAVFSAVQQYFITGWGSLSDIFSFLPAKVEKPRELKAVPLKEPGRLQRIMMQAQAAQSEQQTARQAPQNGNGKAASGDTKEQRYRPDGRPLRGSTHNISANRIPTPPQRVKASDMEDRDEGDGANRPAARSKGSQPRVSGKSIGTSGTPGKPPPVPRKSRQPAAGTSGNRTGDGGSD